MIATHATLGARSAFRETAKALGVSNARVNALARRIPREMDPPYRERLASVAGATDVDWSEPALAKALALAERLSGSPRHLSVHCGGIVIGDRALTHYLPLERAAKDVVVSQFEMRAIEAIGLVKMDLLGNRALSTIGECVSLVRAHGGRDGAIDADRIPEVDPATSARIEAGDTLNCFQLESPAMRHLLRMLRVRTLDDVIAAVALVRPGAAESHMKEAYCRRRRGLEPASYTHPRLAQVLGAAHGVMLYEEDVMCVAATIAGLSLAEGDDLRRAIGAARGDEEFLALERGFVGQAMRAGVDEASARAVWRDLTRFAAYAFCKAHAAGYGTLGWQSAYLKTHFPAEYAVGILNHHAGMYATWAHVEDLRRQGVVFHAPCTQRSELDATLEWGPSGGEAPSSPPATPPSRSVRVGLACVFGLEHATAERIVAARAARPFASLADLVDRARPALPEIESLILAGALDWTRRTRPSLLLEARITDACRRRGSAREAARARAHGRPAAGAALLPDAVAPLALPELPEFDLAGRVRGECRSTGLWFSAHPLDVLVDQAARRDATPAAALPRRVGGRVAVVGLPCATRRVETKQGGAMLFLTLADTSGLAECVLFPDAYRALARAVRGQIVRIEGRVEETLGAITLTVSGAAELGAPAAPCPQAPQSRNSARGPAEARAAGPTARSA
jgi:DNA polymerase III alpha subunit